MDSMSAAPMRFRSPLGLSCRPALLLGQRMPVSLASWDRFASRRYLRGDSRCEALQLPQDWLERGRDEDWSFGQQKLVQDSQSKGLSSHLLHAAFKAVYLGLRLAHLAVQLANHLVADVKRALWWQERTVRAREEVAARKRRAEQQRVQSLRRDEEQKRVQAVYDAQFSRVMQTMDDPSIPLEQKWPAIAQECSRKEEFRNGLSRLFTLAEESSKVMQAASSNPAAFWKSEHTMSVIAQEEALKRQLYMQMLNGAAA
ncbi:hypothetical protein WJX75_009699 [Coccomyxa subellipsoidea]|uniref:Uncharacterized protein n=1 Tax=Coccomyxa subellipsoidea TaxID=248742 RepID=A0ABR2Z1E0_9CHLO